MERAKTCEQANLDYVSLLVGSEVKICLITKCTMIAASSTFLPRALPTNCRSLSRCPQKNSGSSFGCTAGFTSARRPSVTDSELPELQLAQMRAECMIARRMLQAAGDRERSGDGRMLRPLG